MNITKDKKVLKDISIIFSLVLFLPLYLKISPLKRVVDAVSSPAVAGISLLYSTVSTYIYSNTGVDLGMVQLAPDPEFQFSVQLATFVNERKAAPLFEMASDTRLPKTKRERALLALLKFDSPVDWVDPFLNELPKGGLLKIQDGVSYDAQTPLLDELVKRIRQAGGIRQTLVRAYAEVVFSFMLQHPTDKMMAIHGFRWLSDVLAEDAVFLIIPRLSREEDPQVRLAIEKALLDIRAVSEPETARDLLLPYYKKPFWPELRFPLSVVLSRLGQTSALEFVKAMPQDNMDADEQMAMRMALGSVPYPRELKVAEDQERVMAERRRIREGQYLSAIEKDRRLRLKDHLKQTVVRKTGEVPLEKEDVHTEAVVEEKVQPMNEQDSKAVKATQPPPPPAVEEIIPGPIKDDLTYFQAGMDGTIYYKDPHDAAERMGVLDTGVRYMALQSVKVGADRWFLLEIRKDESGWVRGVDLHLADVKQPE